MEIKNLLTGLNPYDRARLEKAEGQKVKNKSEEGTTQKSGDRVDFSDQGKLRTEAFSTANQAPDIRRDKVEEIKARIASGEYQFDNQKIAENLVRDELDLEF